MPHPCLASPPCIDIWHLCHILRLIYILCIPFDINTLMPIHHPCVTHTSSILILGGIASKANHNRDGNAMLVSVSLDPHSTQRRVMMIARGCGVAKVSWQLLSIALCLEPLATVTMS